MSAQPDTLRLPTQKGHRMWILDSQAQEIVWTDEVLYPLDDFTMSWAEYELSEQDYWDV